MSSRANEFFSFAAFAPQLRAARNAVPRRGAKPQRGAAVGSRAAQARQRQRLTFPTP